MHLFTLRSCCGLVCLRLLILRRAEVGAVLWLGTLVRWGSLLDLAALVSWSTVGLGGEAFARGIGVPLSRRLWFLLADWRMLPVPLSLHLLGFLQLEHTYTKGQVILNMYQGVYRLMFPPGRPGAQSHVDVHPFL